MRSSRKIVTAIGPAKVFSLALLAPLFAAPTAHAAGCAKLPGPHHPSAHLSNGHLTLDVYLPDATRGRYRSTRFDWSGVIGCATLDGHTFWGEWTPYSPTVTDSISGPVEEFRSANGLEPGYAEARVRGLFVKLGVGTLRRTSAAPYDFRHRYPIVDPGHWTVHATPQSLIFTQTLHSPIGISYRYTKTLTLDPTRNRLTLAHSLTNLGPQTIDSQVYDHDFFTLDLAPTDKGLHVTFPFIPTATPPLTQYAEVRGQSVRFTAPIPSGEQVWTRISPDFPAGEQHLVVADDRSGLSLTQSWDTPSTGIVFWANPRTVCPEIYLPIHVERGATQHWTITYDLSASHPQPAASR